MQNIVNIKFDKKSTYLATNIASQPRQKIIGSSNELSQFFFLQRGI